MDFTLIKHAEDALRERGIALQWITDTLASPGRTEPDRADTELTRALRAIAEFDNRVLRVIYNQGRDPVHVITAYFDRGMKGRL